MKRTTMILAMTLLAGCTTNSREFTWEQIAGCAAGGTAGGFAGAQVGDGSGQVAASAAGAIAGCLGGAYIATKLTETEQTKAQAALDESMRTRQPVSWEGKDGKTGVFRPENGRYILAGLPDPDTGVVPRNLCQDYAHQIQADGKTITETGVACQSEDGSWRDS